MHSVRAKIPAAGCPRVVKGTVSLDGRRDRGAGAHEAVLLGHEEKGVNPPPATPGMDGPDRIALSEISQTEKDGHCPRSRTRRLRSSHRVGTEKRGYQGPGMRGS